MKGSWRLARLAGVGIDVHWSFSFIILWVIVQGAFEGRAWQHTASVLVGVLLVFGCIMLHEIGHALMALSLNVQVKNIVLLPFGGLAKIETLPHKPLHEVLIAAAGPLVNLALVILLTPVFMLLAGPVMLEQLSHTPVTIVDSSIISFFQHTTLIGLVTLLLVANLILFAFNLIPVFPMDGGRILRAILTGFLPYPQATRLALAVGLALAVALTLLAFQRGSMGLFLVAVFIFFAARPPRIKP